MLGSKLERLCAALCDAVAHVETGEGTQDEKSEPGATTPPPSQEILERLEKSNLFVTPLDPQGEWFRYHHLFQELLAHRLRSETTETERAKLHVAASGWLEQNGLVEEALRQRMVANDYSGAARLVGRHRYALMNETQWQRVEQWLRLFSPDLVDSYADLLMLKAWIFYHHGQYAELSAALERVQNALDEASLDPESAGHLHYEDSGWIRRSGR